MKRSRGTEDDSCVDLVPPSQKKTHYTPDYTSNGQTNGQTNGRECSISCLPVGLLQTLFAHVSLTDLYHCQLVCKKWHEIISRDGFLVWRKLYYKVKLKEEVDEIKAYIEEESLHRVVDFVPNILRVVKQLMFSKFNTHHYLDDTLLPLLKMHPQHQLIEASPLLQKILSEDKRPGCVLLSTCILLIIVSKDVFSTREVFDNVLEHCGVVICTELFYCLATFFYYLWTTKVIPQRLHYQTYYVLKTFEKFKSHSGLEGLTQEQLAVVNHPIKPGETIKVIAFAGTGKTTCLLNFAKKNMNSRFLYLCFNKSVQEHASTVFGKNVVCKTFNALAYQPFVVKYSKDKLNLGPLTLTEVKKVLKFPHGINHYAFLKCLNDTLHNFMVSVDRDIDESHVPKSKAERKNISCIEVLEGAKILWSKMIAKTKEIKMTHDGYVKCYQLSDPEILGYDCLLIDEAQDLTPAIISVIEAQSCPKVIVGDPHQQIYSFRGAVNALDMLKSTHIYYLTESFRFGPNIAFIASCLLDTLKNVQTQTLTGGYQPGGFSGTTEGQVAYIARTNAGLFDKIVEVLGTNPNIRKIALAGKFETYGFNRILDIYRCKSGKDLHKIDDKLVKKFLGDKSPFHKLLNYAENSYNGQLLGKIKICELHGSHIPDVIELLNEKVLDNNIEDADIVFSTTHKSKGLEFETVILANDFITEEDRKMMRFLKIMLSFDEESEEFLYKDDDFDADTDELNMLYVAITRAKRQVYLNKSVLQVLAEGKEHLMFPSLRDENMSVCKKCQSGLSEVCCFIKEPIKLANMSSPIASSGVYCSSCASVSIPHMTAIGKDLT